MSPGSRGRSGAASPPPPATSLPCPLPVPHGPLRLRLPAQSRSFSPSLAHGLPFCGPLCHTPPPPRSAPCGLPACADPRWTDSLTPSLHFLHDRRHTRSGPLPLFPAAVFNIRLLRTLFNITFDLHSISVTGPDTVTARWTMEMVFWLAPWRPNLTFTGRTVYRVSAARPACTGAVRQLAGGWHGSWGSRGTAAGWGVRRPKRGDHRWLQVDCSVRCCEWDCRTAGPPAPLSLLPSLPVSPCPPGPRWTPAPAPSSATPTTGTPCSGTREWQRGLGRRGDRRAGQPGGDGGEPWGWPCSGGSGEGA